MRQTFRSQKRAQQIQTEETQHQSMIIAFAHKRRIGESTVLYLCDFSRQISDLSVMNDTKTIIVHDSPRILDTRYRHNDIETNYQ